MQISRRCLYSRGANACEPLRKVSLDHHTDFESACYGREYASYHDTFTCRRQHLAVRRSSERPHRSFKREREPDHVQCLRPYVAVGNRSPAISL